MDKKSERIMLIEDINRHMNEMLNEISSLKAKNKHLNEYKETGLKELYEARRERDNYLDDIIGLKEENAKLTNQLKDDKSKRYSSVYVNSMQHRLDILEKENEQLKQRIDHLECKLRKLTRENEDYKVQIEALRVHCKDWHAKYEKEEILGIKVVELEKENRILQEHEKEYDKLITVHDKVADSKQQILRENKDLKEINKQWSILLDSKGEQVDELSAGKDKIENYIIDAMKEIVDWLSNQELENMKGEKKNV